jgi:uncharacterized 2Fe-2S/4Fe-4S cluster protein (DUF4445 family)
LTEAISGWVQTVRMERPSFDDAAADAERFKAAVGNACDVERVRLDLPFVQELPQLLRQADFCLTCALCPDGADLVVVAAKPAAEGGSFYGLAVDLGTTRYVVRLVDLGSQATLAESARDNPQGEIGPDILTRIHYAAQDKGREHLQRLIIQDMSACIQELAGEQTVSSRDISLVALAGNTAMTHLFLGLNPYWMIREPYIPAVNAPEPVPAETLGLAVHPRARIWCFPNAGSYFGGDVFSGILSSGLHRGDEVAFLVDVGTNAEVVLGNRDWLIVCAGAAGPALEGGMSAIGRQAGPGVIDRVRIDPESLDFSIRTIGDLPPKGICGSGMIDLAAELFLSGLLDFRGKFVPERLPQRFRYADSIVQLRLVKAEESGTGEDLLIGQPEIDSLIRSKAAMFTILETVVRSVGLDFEAVHRFHVAGTFGSFIDPMSAIAIGMLPDLSPELFESLGNSSLGGATEVLLRPEGKAEVEAVRGRTTYLEMNVNQEFMNRFSAAKFLPHTDSGRFPSVEARLSTRSAGGQTKTADRSG